VTKEFTQIISKFALSCELDGAGGNEGMILGRLWGYNYLVREW